MKLITGECRFAVQIGVLQPLVVVINSTAVNVLWLQPTSPNGLIHTYRVYRSNSGLESALVYSSPADIRSTIDATVEPGVQYGYLVSAENAAGAANSSWFVVTVPQSTPAVIPIITNFTALSSESILIAWDNSTNSTVDQYRVFISDASLTNQPEQPATSSSSSLITGLQPYTWYTARLVACIRGVPNGCGRGPATERIRTWEAPPMDQPSPLLTSTGPTSVLVSWLPPLSPNGLVLLYRVQRRELVDPESSSTDSGVLVNVVNGSVNSFTNVGIDLRPFTVYEYRITAVNSQDEATSNWSSVRTMEAAPRSMLPPVISAVGAYTFFVSWESPSQPNGQIQKYQVEFGIVKVGYVIADVSVLTVPATSQNTSVSGAQPYANQAVRVRAVNSAGHAVSSWKNFSTLAAAPSGVAAPSVELVSGGRSVVISWSPPTQPNGLILNYAVYANTGSNVPVHSGVNLLFEFTALEPYTTYSVQLEACTVAGCTRSPWQQFTTLQAPPANQRTPSVGFVNDSSVLISWSRPLNTFGNIFIYELFRRTVYDAASAAAERVKRSTVEYDVIYATTNTTSVHFYHLDTTVLPSTRQAVYHGSTH